MAATAEGRQLTEQYRVAQTMIAAQTTRQLAQIWPRAFNPANVDASWPGLKAFITTLVNARHRTSAGLGSAYYREFRRLELAHADIRPGATPPVGAARAVGRAAVRDITPRLAPELNPDLVNAVLDITGPVSFKESITRGKTPQQAQHRALVTVSGATQKLVLDGGRTTIEQTALEDPVAIGYSRVTDGDPCAFCAMVASRGWAYRSELTAGRNANVRFGGAGQFKFHDACGCSVEVAYFHDTPLPGRGQEFQDLWYEATADYRAHDKMLAFRRAYEKQVRDRKTAEAEQAVPEEALAAAQ